MDIKEKVSLQLKIWDNPEFYENIFYLFSNDNDIYKLEACLLKNDNLTSDDIFEKVFEICKLDVNK